MSSIVEVAAIMFFASIFRTVFGFGEALLSVPLLALVISVKVAAPIAVLASIVIASYVVFRDWKHIHLREASWLIGSTLLGLPIGLWLLKTVPEAPMKGLLAVLILAFSGYSLLGRRLSLKSDRLAWIFGWAAGGSRAGLTG